MHSNTPTQESCFLQTYDVTRTGNNVFVLRIPDVCRAYLELQFADYSGCVESACPIPAWFLLGVVKVDPFEVPGDVEVVGLPLDLSVSDDVQPQVHLFLDHFLPCTVHQRGQVLFTRVVLSSFGRVIGG